MANNDISKHRGKRAIILTRVSTPDQEKTFSHAAQERQVREKLIRPLGLRIVDEKKYILELIRDPVEVDKKIQELPAKNPAQKQQQSKLKNLNKIRAEQKNLRRNLGEVMKKTNLDLSAVEYLNSQLAILAVQEQEAEKELADEQRVQEQQEDLERRIAAFHQRCAAMREQINNPEFTPDFKFYLDAVLFFGIHVKVWRAGTKPPYEIYTRPPEIVESFSIWAALPRVPFTEAYAQA